MLMGSYTWGAYIQGGGAYIQGGIIRLFESNRMFGTKHSKKKSIAKDHQVQNK